MKCPESVRLLDGYVDNQLDASSVLALEDHLRDCARCRAREQGLRVLHEALHRNTEYVAAPAALRARIEERVGVERGPTARPPRRQFAYAATALVAVALGTAIWHGAPAPSPDPIAGKQARVVYHISSSDRVGAALRTLGNHLDAAPETKVVVVAHNEGVNFLLRGARDENGRLVEPVVHAFRGRGVEFRVCTNTLVRRKMDAGLVVPDATLVPSGIAEISRLQEKEGYAYMRM
jgi:intracellular sulfur oxidation DsrE/DsrF family protein